MREYEDIYDYHSPDNWELDTLIAHLADRVTYYTKKEKYAFKNWLRPSMTAQQLEKYYHDKKIEYENYLESVLIRKKQEEK